MSFKEQLEKIKDNWFLILLVFVVIIIFLFSTTIGRGLSSRSYAQSAAYESLGYEYSDIASSYNSAYYPGAPGTSTFAPEEIYRQVIKNASMGIEIKTGKFEETDAEVKEIVNSKGGFILKENINTNIANIKYIYNGTYTIKVKATEFDSTIAQLKTIGKVTSLNEGADDVTGKYTNNKIELETEKQRLLRYQEMYSQATNINDKINLNDRIFNQERVIGYLEDSLKSIEERVDYSTITLTVREKSNYIGIVFVRFSELVRSFVNSTNSLLQFIASILPWAAFGLLVYFVIKLIKKTNKPKETTQTTLKKK